MSKFLMSLLFFTVHSPAWTYDVVLSTRHAHAWWNTDIDGNSFTDHVATPTYTWYYGIDNDRSRITTDDGTNRIPKKWGYDCANFVSRALIEGGILGFDGPGRNRTVLLASALGGRLRSISTGWQTPFSSPSGAPNTLSPGDVVIFDDSHATLVVAGSASNVVLAGHNLNTITGSLAGSFTHSKYARAYHITGNLLQAQLDFTAPTITIQDENGRLIIDQGYTAAKNISIKISDSGDGINALQVTTGAPIFNRNQDLIDGTISYVFADPTFHGPGHTYNTIDINALQNGIEVFVQAFDAAGNSTVASFAIASPDSSTRTA